MGGHQWYTQLKRLIKLLTAREVEVAVVAVELGPFDAHERLLRHIAVVAAIRLAILIKRDFIRSSVFAVFVDA